MFECPGVGQGVVIEKETGGNVEGDDDVDGVMFVSSQDKESTKDVEYPGQCVEKMKVTRRV